jgi:hypothetical protein
MEEVQVGLSAIAAPIITEMIVVIRPSGSQGVGPSRDRRHHLISTTTTEPVINSHLATTTHHLPIPHLKPILSLCTITQEGLGDFLAKLSTSSRLQDVFHNQGRGVGGSAGEGRGGKQQQTRPVMRPRPASCFACCADGNRPSQDPPRSGSARSHARELSPRQTRHARLSRSRGFSLKIQVIAPRIPSFCLHHL